MFRKEALLFEKRSKNFYPLARALQQRARHIIKSFLVLFFKKELLLLLCPLPAQASGVVSLNLCTDQLLVLLAPNQITALSPLARDPVLSVVAPQAQTLPWVRPDAEAVLALHPDLVLAGTYGAQAVVAVLKAHGLRVVQVAEPNSFDAIATQVTTVSTALNKQPTGAAMIAAMRARLAAIHAGQRGTAVLWGARGFTAGPGDFGDAVLRQAGYRNIGTGGAMGVEALAAHPPGTLITEAAPAYPSLATNLLWHPALGGIPRRTVSPPLLACPGPWSTAAVEKLAQP